MADFHPLGVLSGIAAGATLRRRDRAPARPPRLKLAIELDTTEPVLPGTVLSGSVCARDHGGRVRSLRLRLELVERRAGFERVVRHAGDQVLAAGRLSAPRRVPFTLQIPADAAPGIDAPPHAWRGWQLRAWADVRGPDPCAVHPIRVVTRF